MRFITGCNEPYLIRMRTYLETLEQFADFKITFVTVGFDWGSPFSKINVIRMEPGQNEGAPPQSEAIQHGSFLKVLESKVTEVLVCTDGDFVMQRPLDDDEKALLSLKHGEVVTSWNGGPDETLVTEAGRLGMKVTYEKLAEDWGEIVKSKPIYNVGFIGLTRKTWKQVYELYMANWDRVGEYFSHPARQQWLISWALADLELKVKVAPWSLHAHGHFGPKPGMVRGGDGRIYVDGKLAAFRHYL